jgi:orotate phosphoribosyltransferase
MIANAMTKRQQLIEILRARSIKRGDYVLASGKSSSIYIDARLTTMSAEGLALIGPIALHAIRKAGWDIDAIGGLTLGADPIAYAIALASYSRPPLVHGFTVRKKLKTHGTGKLIEGPFYTGDRVVIVEDVITTGGSALKAIEAVRSAGGDIRGVLALVDREEEGQELIQKHGYPVISLFRLRELAKVSSPSTESSDSADE